MAHRIPNMYTDRCAGCGAVLKGPARNSEVCPYCGAHPATGRGGFKAIESGREPDEVRAVRKRHTRAWGALQLVAGLILIAIYTSRTSRPFYALLLAGLLAGHGLFRIVFGSGANRDDDDYDNG